MENHALDFLCRLLVNTPVVALRVDGERGVVVEVVERAAVAVVLERVVAGVVVIGIGIVHFADVHVLAAEHGDAPQVALDGVAGNRHVRLCAIVVDADSGTACHCA